MIVNIVIITLIVLGVVQSVLIYKGNQGDKVIQNISIFTLGMYFLLFLLILQEGFGI